MQNIYVVSYYSENNVLKGKIAISANTLVEVQDKFFSWLREQPVYTHMWNLSISVEEIEDSIV